MKISSIKKVNIAGSRLKGVASVILDDGEIVNDIKIVEGYAGLFIDMHIPKHPSDRSYNYMDKKEENEYSAYMESLKKLDKFVLDEFKKL